MPIETLVVQTLSPSPSLLGVSLAKLQPWYPGEGSIYLTYEAITNIFLPFFEKWQTFG